MAENIIDWTQLRQFWELMEDDGESVEDLIQTFLSDAPKQLAKFPPALAENDKQQLGRVAHTLKGSSATMGAQAFAELCRVVEHGVKQEADRDFAADVLAIENSYKELEDVLINWRNHLEKPEF